MKKLLLVCAVVAFFCSLSMIDTQAVKQTAHRPGTPPGGLALEPQAAAAKPSEPIRVTNLSNKDVYVALYEEYKGKAPQQFGLVYTIRPNDAAVVMRPKWSTTERLPIFGHNRNVYFSATNSTNPRAGNQFFNVGNNQGTEFIIYPANAAGKPEYPGTQLKGSAESTATEDAVAEGRRLYLERQGMIYH